MQAIWHGVAGGMLLPELRLSSVHSTRNDGLKDTMCSGSWPPAGEGSKGVEMDGNARAQHWMLAGCVPAPSVSELLFYHFTHLAAVHGLFLFLFNCRCRTRRLLFQWLIVVCKCWRIVCLVLLLDDLCRWLCAQQATALGLCKS